MTRASPKLKAAVIVTYVSLRVVHALVLTLSVASLLIQCFDAVGWVIWPVKPVPDMTYNVFGGTPVSYTHLTLPTKRIV